jgi:hypothetical protein
MNDNDTADLEDLKFITYRGYKFLIQDYKIHQTDKSGMVAELQLQLTPINSQ